jgi:transglutaminase-like putative cysteine protease
MGRDTLPPAELAPRTARTGAALASAATIWCLQSAGLLSTGWFVGVLLMLFVVEVAGFLWPRPLPKYTLPTLLICSELLLLYALSRGDMTSVRPFGAQTAAITLVLFSLAGPKRRDLLTRLVLGTFSAALAVAAGGRATIFPAIAVALASGYVLIELERAATSPNTTSTISQPAPQLGRVRILALPVAVALIVSAVLAATLALPQHRQPLASLGNSDSTDTGLSSTDSGSGTDTGSQARLSDVASDEMNLNNRGTLPDTPIATIRSLDSDPESVLWRANTLMTYDGAGWSSDGADSTVAASGSVRTDEVTPLLKARISLLSPGTPVSVTVDGRTYRNPQQPASMPPVTYRVSSVMPNSTASLVTTTAVAAPASNAEALRLPDELPDRVLDLSQQLTEGAATRQQAVESVVSYLRQHEKYKLDSPVPAEGEDAVDDFLFRDHTGFCEQFASAAAVLLRASDVPTRIVTGYASGEVQSDGSWLIRGKEAHAWIEVEYPGVGWLPVDPTAGVALAPSSSGHSALALVVGVIVIVVLAVLVTVAVTFFRRRQRRRSNPIQAGLADLDAALGDARRRPTESLRDLAARVPLQPGEVNALATAERAFYGASALPEAEVTATATALHQTARRIRHDRLVPGRRPTGG